MIDDRTWDVCSLRRDSNKLCANPGQYTTAPCKLTFDLLILKVVSESSVTLSISVPNLVFSGLSVLDLGPMYGVRERDRQTKTDVRCASSLNARKLVIIV